MKSGVIRHAWGDTEGGAFLAKRNAHAEVVRRGEALPVEKLLRNS